MARLKARDSDFVSRHVVSNVVFRTLSATQAEGAAYFAHFADQLRGRELPLPINGALGSVGQYQMHFMLRDGA